MMSDESRGAPAATGLDVRHSLPRIERLYLELTNACNFSCAFCPRDVSDRETRHMDLGLFTRVLDEVVRERLTDTIALHVLGEPLAHPRLLLAVELGKERGLKVELTTNGSLLDDHTVRELDRRGLDVLVVSIVALDECDHDARRTRMPFDVYRARVLRAVELLSSLGSRMRVELRVITPYTRRFFSVDRDIGLRSHARRKFLDALRSFVTDVAAAACVELPEARIRQVLETLDVNDEQIVWVRENLGVFLRPFVDWGNAFSTRRIHPCRVGYCGLAFTNLSILSNGEVPVCCADFDGRTSLGNVTETPLAELLASPRASTIWAGFRRYRVRHSHCRRCLGGSNPVLAFIKGLASIYLYRFRAINRPQNVRRLTEGLPPVS